VNEPDTATAIFRLGWEGRALEAHVSVPTGRVSPRILLPQVQQFTNQLVGLGESLVAERGETVSCRAGCGACCRQLVALSETEARHVRDLVDAMPEPRQQLVKSRFAEAGEALTHAGMIELLRNLASIPDTTALGVRYLGFGIPCPFLEDESCSIHPDRPLQCREYLVTSPAENCRTPSLETIRRVPTPGWVMTSFATLDGPPLPGMPVRWVPLVLALEWADAHPEPPATETGPELFSKFMTAFTRKTIPPLAPVEASP
jgi:Fe-S-cluster containining protein